MHDRDEKNRIRRETLKSIIRLRQWQNENFPMHLSLIGLDVFFHIARLALNNRDTLIKDLYNALPYSEPAIRKHLQRMVSEGYILEQESSDDLRSKAFRLTPKALCQVDAFLHYRVAQKPAVKLSPSEAVPATTKRSVNNARLELLSSAIRVREWQSRHLPIAQSLVALDVFLHIAHHSLIGQFTPLKSLYASLLYSKPAIRKYLKYLSTEGYVLVHESPEDKRSTSFSLSDNALQLIDQYLIFRAMEDARMKAATRQFLAAKLADPAGLS